MAWGLLTCEATGLPRDSNRVRDGECLSKWKDLCSAVKLCCLGQITASSHSSSLSTLHCTTAWALLQAQYCPVTTLCTTELTSFTDMEVLWRWTVDSLIGYYSVHRRYQSPGGILKRLLSMNHEMSCGTESTMLGDKCNSLSHLSDS